MTEKAVVSQPEHETTSQHPSVAQTSSSFQSSPSLPQMMSPSVLKNPHIPLAQRQRAVLAIQRELGNRQLTNMIQRHVAHLGELEVENYRQLVALMRLGMTAMREAMTDVDHETEVYREAQTWLANVREMLPRMQREGEAELSENAAVQAQTYYEDYNTIRENLTEWRQRRIRSELRRARQIIEQRHAALQALQPQIDEQMRRAYLSNNTATITQIVNFSSFVLDVSLSLNGLSRDLMNAVGTSFGTGLAEAGRITEILNRFNQVLAAINLLVTYQNPDAAPNQISEATTQLNNLTALFSAGSTLLDFAPHIGLYCNLYLGPAVQFATTHVQQTMQDRTRALAGFSIDIGTSPSMENEPGGSAMFNFMVPVMHAQSESDVPAVPDAVRTYLLNHREMIDIGAREDMPTQRSWILWHDLDPANIQAWVFTHREQLWAMFYGHMTVPAVGTRARE